MGNQAYPVTSKWHDLGTYTAASAGIGKQDFELKEPSWARYLTHYGVEHYCTVSQIMVHGSTMLQGFHEQWTQSEKETNDLLRLEEDVVETDNQHEKTERKENIHIVDEHKERNIVNESEIKASDESISHGDQIEKTDKDDKSEDVSPDINTNDSDVTPENAMDARRKQDNMSSQTEDEFELTSRSDEKLFQYRYRS